MKRKLFISLIVISFTIITAFGIEIPLAKQYTAYRADYIIEIDGEEKNDFLYPVVSIEDKAYVALTDFASSVRRIVQWLPEQNKIRVTERKENMDTSNELIIYTDRTTGMQGFKDKEGNIVIEAAYSYVDPFKEGLAKVCDARRELNKPLYGFINQKGEVVIPIKYTSASDFNNGVAAVTSSFFYEDWYYIKKDGSLFLDKKFRAADPFCEGVACIMTQGNVVPDDNDDERYSYIDLSGERATELEFEKASDFKNGYADVTLNGVEGYIDTQFNFYEGKR